MTKIVDELEKIDAKAKEQGHSLRGILEHVARTAFGISVAEPPPDEAELARLKAEAEKPK